MPNKKKRKFFVFFANFSFLMSNFFEKDRMFHVTGVTFLAESNGFHEKMRNLIFSDRTIDFLTLVQYFGHKTGHLI